ncbi:glycosyltransferase [Marinobacter sp.]|uniref:glycosyltransferase n=1 Tax=Marinobacter sp. TaxID=50741 RepID=UPI0034A3C570
MAASDGHEQLTFVVPGNPDQNTGGYRYVNRLVGALNGLGHPAHVVGVGGQFPFPDEEAVIAVDELLASLPDHSRVVLDGLAMGGVPQVIERHAGRLVLVALVHHPLADETGLEAERKAWFFRSEKRALAAVEGVIATSEYTAARLADFGVSAARVNVARPGVDRLANPVTQPKVTDTELIELLCVAHLSPRKAQLHLVEALSELTRLPWHCTLVGSDQRDAGYSATVKRAVAARQLQDRVTIAGELDESAVNEAYQRASLFVFPSLYEGYGMAIDEALAAGLPVVTSDGGALARVADMPGVQMFPAGDIQALADLLAKLMAQPHRLSQLRQDARMAHARVQTWARTAEAFLAGLEALQIDKSATLFDARWLELREPADHQARNRELSRKLTTWVERAYRSTVPHGGSRSPIAIVDLGSGAGSNACFLAPAIPVPQHWTLLDQDARLLGRAKDRVAALDIPLDAVVAELSPLTLAHHIPDNVQVITASALIDLVPAPWLEALADCAATRRAAVFVVLSYSGDFSLSPAHPDDGLMLQLVNEHQHGHKGKAAALGPEAPAVLKRMLVSRGYQVTIAESPWQLDSTHAELQRALIEGWCAAAIEQAPAMAVRIHQWQDQRQQQAADGELTVHVSHQDLLALPADAQHGGA